MTSTLIPCIGCGGLFPETDGPTHRYMESSPGCWTSFGEVLALEYSDVRYGKVHRLTVDTFAIQHLGRPSPQSIQSVALHLISLCAILEKSVEIHRATQILQKCAKDKRRFRWLAPPSSMGPLTVAEIHEAENAEEHIRLVWEWAEASWAAWSDHHDRIRTWLAECYAA